MSTELTTKLLKDLTNEYDITIIAFLTLSSYNFSTLMTPHFQFSELTNLRELNVSDNCLTSIENLSFCENLMRLDISNNRIFSVPKNTFTGCKLLEFLALEGNDIESNIDGLEEIKDSLRVLYLASSSQVAANSSSSYLQDNNKTNTICERI